MANGAQPRWLPAAEEMDFPVRPDLVPPPGLSGWWINVCCARACVPHRLPLLPVYMHTPEPPWAALVRSAAIAGTELPVWSAWEGRARMRQTLTV